MNNINNRNEIWHPLETEIIPMGEYRLKRMYEKNEFGDRNYIEIQSEEYRIRIFADYYFLYGFRRHVEKENHVFETKLYEKLFAGEMEARPLFKKYPMYCIENSTLHAWYGCVDTDLIFDYSHWHLAVVTKEGIMDYLVGHYALQIDKVEDLPEDVGIANIDEN